MPSIVPGENRQNPVVGPAVVLPPGYGHPIVIFSMNGDMPLIVPNENWPHETLMPPGPPDPRRGGDAAEVTDGPRNSSPPVPYMDWQDETPDGQTLMPSDPPDPTRWAISLNRRNEPPVPAGEALMPPRPPDRTWGDIAPAGNGDPERPTPSDGIVPGDQPAEALPLVATLLVWTTEPSKLPPVLAHDDVPGGGGLGEAALALVPGPEGRAGRGLPARSLVPGGASPAGGSDAAAEAAGSAPPWELFVIGLDESFEEDRRTLLDRLFAADGSATDPEGPSRLAGEVRPQTRGDLGRVDDPGDFDTIGGGLGPGEAPAAPPPAPGGAGPADALRAGPARRAEAPPPPGPERGEPVRVSTSTALALAALTAGLALPSLCRQAGRPDTSARSPRGAAPPRP